MSTADIRRLGIVADALAGNAAQPGLMLDANESWNLKQAVRYVSAVEAEYDLTWIEEPLRRWDAAGHARLSSSIRAAVATGENLTGLEQYRPLLDAHAIDIVQAAATWGVTHFLRVAYAAHSAGPAGEPGRPHREHRRRAAAAAIPNHLTAEVQDLGSPFGVTIPRELRGRRHRARRRARRRHHVDEAAITGHPDFENGWLQDAGPHVRPARAGLRAGAERDGSEVAGHRRRTLTG